MNTTSHIDPALMLRIASARRNLGERCFNALLEARPASKEAVMETVRKHQQTTTPLSVLVEIAVRLLADLRRGKAAKAPARFAKARRRCPYFQAVHRGEIQAPALPWSDKAYRLPTGTPQERVAALRSKRKADGDERLRESLRKFLRCTRTEEQTVRRLLPAAKFARITGEAWGVTRMVRYPSRHCYPQRFASFNVTIPHDYEKTVVNQGLQLIGGMFTLIAQPQPTDLAGGRVWKAKWLRKGGGFRTFLCEGYIVRIGQEYAHGKTEAIARRVLARREIEQKRYRREMGLYTLLESGNCPALRAVTVTIADSLAAGNCESGTLSFRDDYFPGRDSATIGEILSIEHDVGTRHLAISACLHAVLNEARRCPSIRAAYLSAVAPQQAAEPAS